MKKSIFIGILALSILTACNKEKTTKNIKIKEVSKEVNVYTHRHYPSDQVLFAQFEKETGITVNVVNASADELMQKMTLEGNQSPADVLITVDAGRLVRAVDKGLLQSVTSKTLDSIIPLHLRDKDGQWFGLTKRARVIAYAKERIKPEDLSTYENLANNRWKGKILVRSSGNIYNQSLMASLIANNGEEVATGWAKKMVENMARSPKGNDRDQVKAVVAGEGDVAIVNTYYIGKLLNSKDPEEVKSGKGVGIFFPNQEGRGTHINISGAGVAKFSPKSVPPKSSITLPPNLKLPVPWSEIILCEPLWYISKSLPVPNLALTLSLKSTPCEPPILFSKAGGEPAPVEVKTCPSEPVAIATGSPEAS